MPSSVASAILMCPRIRLGQGLCPHSHPYHHFLLSRLPVDRAIRRAPLLAQLRLQEALATAAVRWEFRAITAGLGMEVPVVVATPLTAAVALRPRCRRPI